MATSKIRVNGEKCIGCGQCISACNESAIALVDGKAKLINERHCDGLGKCLPICPVDAITIEDENEGHLNQWPVQIQLVPVNAKYFDDADLLVAADCAAYAYGGFHREFMRNKITIIGCPKLDDYDYHEKLTAIVKSNDVKSLTIARMEVPCCSGIEEAAKVAIRYSGKLLPWSVVTLSTDGKVLSR